MVWNVWLIVETVAIATVILLVYGLMKLALHIRYIENCFKGVKTPSKFHRVFGTIPYLPADHQERAMYFVNEANSCGKEDGYFVLWGFLRKPILVPCSTEVMAKICKSSEPKAVGLFGIYRMIRPWLGDGLLVANGSKWARNRRLLTPAFHFEILKPYVQVFNKSADTLVKKNTLGDIKSILEEIKLACTTGTVITGSAKLANKADKMENFEVQQTISLCTLEIIMKCAFSYNKDVQTMGDRNPYVQTVNRITNTLQYRFERLYLYPDFTWKLSSVGKQFYKDCDYVHDLAQTVISERQATLEKGGDGVKTKRYVDFLDILLTAKDENGVGMSPLEIRNEVDTFLFEGHDTTASAISWILYSLALNPECQSKCQAEIDNILNNRETDDIEWADLSKLEYVTMCIKEGMRLHTPVPIVTRETEREFTVGDRTFPKNILVQINIWVMNHLESVWGADHMDFKPERFSKDNVTKMDPFQFIPFSAGSRNCIGQHFAMNEEKVVLSKLLRNFTFTVDEKVEVRKRMSAVMRAENGMYMYVAKKTHAH